MQQILRRFHGLQSDHRERSISPLVLSSIRADQHLLPDYKVAALFRSSYLNSDFAAKVGNWCSGFA